MWVKNEWSRYLALIRGGAKKTLIPAYRDMDPYDLPEEFSHLQAQDMSKLGFMQDLIRGIKKILETDKPKEAEPVVVQAAAANTNLITQLKRGQIALEDKDWEAADSFFDKALDLDAECAEAYFGKALAYSHCVNGEAFVQLRLGFQPTTETLVACNRDENRIEEAVRKYTVPNFLRDSVIRSFFSYDERTFMSETAWLKSRVASEAQYWKQHRLVGRAVRFAKGDFAASIQALNKRILEELKRLATQSEENDKKEAEMVRERYSYEMNIAENQAYNAYVNAVNSRNAKISELACKQFEIQNELNNMKGLFSGKRKKELEAQIELLENQKRLL